MRLKLELPTEDRTILLEPSQVGQKLTQVLRKEQLPLNTRCGERHLCKSCTVEVLRDGLWIPEASCQLLLDQDLTVRIPQFAMLAYAPQIQSGYRVNVSYGHNPLFGSEGLAAAIDIGTTTVALSLVDLKTGSVVATTSSFNRQMHLGDDVLTRINLCFSDPSGVRTLQTALIEQTLNPLIAEALEVAGAEMDQIKGVVLAGNTTMLHLAVGADPSQMGVAPFTPQFIGHETRISTEIGLNAANVPVHLLPGTSAYVGADITGGVFASSLAYDDGPSLLVDVGTNGEIVLKTSDRLYACATAAGPAFEGSGLQCGIRAGDGAISHITLNDSPFEVTLEIIGPDNTKPVGICGSAYVDFLAQGYKSGLLHASGRIDAAILPPDDSRIRRSEYGFEFVLTRGLGKREIVIAETDVARLLQAKAAIAAGITILLTRVGLAAKDVKTLYLAGGFGMHLNIENAITGGLLPGFHPDQIQLVGNTSLAGAAMCAIDASVLEELSRIGRQIEIVELNLDPDFEDTYIDQLALG